MQKKPGIGWIRGDKAGAEEALSKELTILSKENRELREKIIDLESKISLKKPVIELEIAPLVIDDNFNSYEKVEMPTTLKLSDIEDHLLEYISEEDIDIYNNSIPSQDQLEKYNDELAKSYKINNYSVPLTIEVSNKGSSKANNMYIDIEFPEGVLIYKNSDEPNEPKSPIPLNPVDSAQAEYNKKIKEQGSPLARLQASLGFVNGLNKFEALAARPNFNLPDIHPVNLKWWTKLDGNKITVKIDSLLHTRCMVFDDEYMIVPLIAGKHTIEIQVICEEYENIDTKLIEFNI